MKETDDQREALAALTRHPAVAWIRRYNSADVPIIGSGKYRRITCVRAAPGIEFKQLDLMGQLKDGRLLAIEMKTKNPKRGEHYEKQVQEIEYINTHGGIAYMADSAESAIQRLDEMLAVQPHSNQ